MTIASSDIHKGGCGDGTHEIGYDIESPARFSVGDVLVCCNCSGNFTIEARTYAQGVDDAVAAARKVSYESCGGQGCDGITGNEIACAIRDELSEGTWDITRKTCEHNWTDWRSNHPHKGKRRDCTRCASWEVRVRTKRPEPPGDLVLTTTTVTSYRGDTIIGDSVEKVLRPERTPDAGDGGA